MGAPGTRLTASVRLAPAAVLVDSFQEESARSSNPLTILVRLTLGRKAFQCEHSGVREANGPAAVPRSVRPLISAYPLYRPSYELVDLVGTIARIPLLEEMKCCDTGCSALGIPILNHNPTKDLGRIQVFHPFTTSLNLVRAAGTIGVLHGQENVNGPLDPLFREQLWEQFLGLIVRV